MSIYKSYKHGGTIKGLVKDYGVRKTFTSLKRNMKRGLVRIKHNRIQMLNGSKWEYKS